MVINMVILCIGRFSMWFWDTHRTRAWIYTGGKDFYNENLESLIRNIPNRDHLVVRADRNGYVGMDDEGYEGVHG